MATRLLLDERILGDGRHVRTFALTGTNRVEIVDEDGTHGHLSVVAVERVMTKYGLPLEDDVELSGEALDLGEGRRLRRLRYHAKVDAEGRDYLVWEQPDAQPLAVIATHATAALRYLVLRLQAPSEI